MTSARCAGIQNTTSLVRPLGCAATPAGSGTLPCASHTRLPG